MKDNKSDITRKLAAINIFKHLSQEELTELAKHIKEETVSKGQMVIKEGESGDLLFIIKYGEVEILKSTLGGDHYTVVKLNHTMQAFFGEMALIADDKRSASILALEDCEFYTMSKKDFVDLGDRYPKIGLYITREIAKILAGRIQKTTSDVVTIFQALIEEVESPE